MSAHKMYQRKKDLCRQCKSLDSLRPDIAAQWYTERNGDLRPDDIDAGSKKKVWWQCPEGSDHEWEATIGSRTGPSRKGYCPFCSGRKVSSDNSLAITHPELAAEWHPTKNGRLTPKDVRLGTKREVWWQCPKVADHEYPMPVQSRTAKRYPQGCPYCSRRKLRRDMSLGAVYPDVSAEWHKTRNDDLSPFDVAPGNKRQIWWQCKLHEEHVWRTTPLARTTMGSGCPFCAPQASRLELRVFSELHELFPEAKRRAKIEGMEADIYLPKLKLAVEVDGVFYHRNKLRKDKKKNEVFERNDIAVVRLREGALKKIRAQDIAHRTSDSHNSIMMRLAASLGDLVQNQGAKRKLRRYLKDGNLVAETEYLRILSYLPAPPPEQSLGKIIPEIAANWHPEKNGLLTPFMFKPFSAKTVWWQCPIHQNHEWQAKIATVSANSKKSPGNTGCPFCSGRKLSIEKSFLVLCPEAAKAWHATKNKSISPEAVSPWSQDKVWWRCIDCGHEWEAQINSRRDVGHPFCRLCRNYTPITDVFPEIVTVWDSDRDQSLTLARFARGSAQKIHLKCPNCGYKWPIPREIKNVTRRGLKCTKCKHEVAPFKA